MKKSHTKLWRKPRKTEKSAKLSNLLTKWNCYKQHYFKWVSHALLKYSSMDVFIDIFWTAEFANMLNTELIIMQFWLKTNKLSLNIKYWLIHDRHLNAPSPFFTWWRHQMETFSALLVLCEGNSPATGEFPAQGPVTRSFAVFFDLRLNKRLSK